MIITNAYKYFWTSCLDASVEEELTEDEFIDIVNRFRSVLQAEWGSTYKKYWILDDGKKSEHYLVKRLVGIKEVK